jgi:hypothetical protein
MTPDAPKPSDKTRWESVHICPKCGYVLNLAEIDLKTVTTGIVECPRCDWSGLMNLNDYVTYIIVQVGRVRRKSCSFMADNFVREVPHRPDTRASVIAVTYFPATSASWTTGKQDITARLGRKKAKTVLRLPGLEHAKAAVLNSLTSADAQRGYRHAIDEFVDWYCSEPRLAFNRIVVLRYRSYLESRQLAPGTVNLRLGAVRRLAYEAADCGLLSSDLAAGIRRVKGVKKLGVRLGNWLTAEQAHSLWQAPDRPED